MAFLLNLLIASAAVFAHPVDLGTMNVSQNAKNLNFSLNLPLPIVTLMTGLTESRLQSLDDLGPVLFSMTLGETSIHSTESGCSWNENHARFQDKRIIFDVVATCTQPPNEWQLDLPFLSRTSQTFELVTKVVRPSGEIVESTLNMRARLLEVKSRPSRSWGEFIKLGVLHIGVGISEWWGAEGFHFPDGIDHILFVIGLVLCSGEIIAVLKTVTGFTLGHSITLALATFHLVNIPGRIVEPAIALSIAYVAGERLFRRRSRDHWRLAMLFGLIHGLGFATVLSELKLERMDLLRALVGFNIGVECGQVFIVLATFPIIRAIDRQSWGRKFVTPALAAIIFIAGIYWFISRAFGFL